jgi:hypothetical protein
MRDRPIDNNVIKVIKPPRPSDLRSALISLKNF